MNIRTRIACTLAAVGLAAAALTGCTASGAPPTDEEAAVEPTRQAEAVTAEDAWIKTAESGMTPAFGVLSNSSGEEVNVVAVTTDAASVSELHETVENESGEMVMQPIEGGFVIPAGGSFALEPAGNHLMLMDLAAPVTAGQEVVFTLEFADGSTTQFTAVAKDYSGANENYVGDTDEMGDMEMGGDE